jgi:hypothetical protein
VPTLVVDGADDRIDAESNDRDVAAEFAHSRLVFYPDAGHAFLFQEGVIFTFLVQSFLVPAAAPVSNPVLRERYVAEQKAVTSVGALWLAKLKSLSKKSTLRDVAVNDLNLADTLGALDDVLLSSGAVGKVGEAVSSFVVADERDASDVQAIGGQGASPIKDFSAASTNDGHVTLLLENALRPDLNLSPIPTTSTTTTSTSTTTTTVFSY